MGVTRLQHKKTAHKQINCIQTDKLIRNGFANCNLDKSYASQQLGFQQSSHSGILHYQYLQNYFQKKNQQNTDFPSLFPKKINNKICWPGKKHVKKPGSPIALEETPFFALHPFRRRRLRRSLARNTSAVEIPSTLEDVFEANGPAVHFTCQRFKSQKILV